jgi:hypothetical protein
VTLKFEPNGSETVCAQFDDGTDAGCTDAAATVVRYGNVAPFSTCATGGFQTGYLVATQVTFPSPITLTALGTFAVSGGPHAVLALYASSGGAPGALVAFTASTTLGTGVNEIPVAQKVAVAAGTYWLAGEYDAVASICGDSASTNLLDYIPVTYGSVPNPWSPAPASYSGSDINYYVVGTL